MRSPVKSGYYAWQSHSTFMTVHDRQGAEVLVPSLPACEEGVDP